MIKKAAQAILIALCFLIFSPRVFAISTFVKYPQNPILTPGTSPSILKKDNQYMMWYGINYGQGWRINYANSPDGINDWIVPYQEVIPVGSLDVFEKDVAEHYVLFNPILNKYQMWYSSVSQNWTSGCDRFRLRYATSDDGTVNS